MGKLITSTEEHVKQDREQLLKAFRECMARQYASAIREQGGLTQIQLRDVARTFAMGWCEALAAKGDFMRVHYWAINFGNMTTPDWWPGVEWEFWN